MAMQEFAQEYAKVWFHVPSSFALAGGMYMLRAGRNAAKPGYHVGPKRIECHSVHFILEGELSLHHQGTDTVLSTGDIFVLYPDAAYTYRRLSDEVPLRMVWLALVGEQVPYVLSKAGFSLSAPYVRNAISKKVRSLLSDLLRLLPRLAACELTVLQRLYTLFERLAATADSPVRRTEGERSDWVAESKTYIELHFAEQLSISDIADRFGVHRSHFSSRFARETGVSPKQYMVQLRMEKGRQLLKTTGLSVSEVALTVGYPDMYSFTRAFTAYFGYPPSSAREYDVT